MVEKLKVEMYNYIQDLDISEELKKKIYKIYVKYIDTAVDFVLKASFDTKLFNKNLILYERNFKAKLDALVNYYEKPDECIKFLRENYTNLRPYMLNEEYVKLLNKILDPSFDYIEYCLSYQGPNYKLFCANIRGIAMIFGYEEKTENEYKTSNKRYKTRYIDRNIPPEIRKAIKSVE